MDIEDILEKLKELAMKDENIRQKLLDTKNDKNPISAFCNISCELGSPMYVMDLIAAGEDSYAAMKRSTNGGGENSPLLEGQNDYYELFLAEIK